MTDTPECGESTAAQALASTAGHVPVLLEEAVVALRPRAEGVIVDGTFGGGGHSRRLLDHQPRIATLIGVDADPTALERSRELRDSLDDPDRFIFLHTNFRDLGTVLDGIGVWEIDGLLLDLGVSSYQFDEGERGFSFRTDAPLDMRFDQSRGESAHDLVNRLPQEDLAGIIWEFGEERQSRRIATAVVRARSSGPIDTTQQLAGIVEAAVGGRRGAPTHPATRTFQALRIAVNDELGALPIGLAAATGRLRPGGRLVVISFHSLEDRIVKRFIEQEARTCVCPATQPVCTCDTVPRLKRIGRPVRPDAAEQRANPRSRSAIMRVAERLDAGGVPVTQGHTT